MPASASPAQVIAAVRKTPGHRVKVAVSDIDGILRGKYIHKEKFESAVEGGFGFCDVVFGWDCNDTCYDNTTLTGWHKGFPDALARLDLSTHRNVPWDDGVDFFLGEFVVHKNGREEPFPLDGRQVLKRVLKRAEKLGVMPMCGLEFEWFNFAETPQSWADKKGVGPTPITPGMFGYSLLRANHSREYFAALFSELAAFRVPIEGLHTETGPGVFEVAIVFSEALEAADRRFLGARQAHLGRRQSHRELPGHRRLTEIHTSRDAVSGRGCQSLPCRGRMPRGRIGRHRAELEARDAAHRGDEPRCRRH